MWSRAGEGGPRGHSVGKALLPRQIRHPPISGYTKVLKAAPLFPLHLLPSSPCQPVLCLTCRYSSIPLEEGIAFTRKSHQNAGISRIMPTSFTYHLPQCLCSHDLHFQWERRMVCGSPRPRKAHTSPPPSPWSATNLGQSGEAGRKQHLS